MNKKIIAIAIASAMAAPVAMADIKVSGQLGGALVDTSIKTTAVTFDMRPIQESGWSKLQFDMTSGGTGYARGALRLHEGYQGGAPLLRDTYFGVKGDWGSFQLGRMGSALKNLEADPYISTFLGMRGTGAVPGDASESTGFVNGLVQYAGKVGAVDIKVQYNPMTNAAGGYTVAGTELAKGNQEGMTAFSVKGKVAGVSLYAATASWDEWACTLNTATPTPSCTVANVATENSYTKLGASMKFGAIKASVQMGTVEAGTTDTDSMHVMANMGLGNGLSVNAVIGSSEKTAGAVKTDTDYTRIAFSKNLSKGTALFGGYTVNDIKGQAETTQMGVGLQVKF